jgi:hypothetical protein
LLDLFLTMEPNPVRARLWARIRERAAAGTGRRRRRRRLAAGLLLLAAATPGWRALAPHRPAGGPGETVAAPKAGRGSGPPAEALEALTRELPDGLWLDRIEERPGGAVVDGRALDLGAVAEWLEELHLSEALAEVELRQLRGHRYLDPGVAGSGYSFTLALGDPTDGGRDGAGSAADREARPTLDRLPWLGDPASAPEVRSSAGSGWLAATRVDELELVGVYRSSLGPVARVRSPRHRDAVVLRIGDRLNDGEVVWIGFPSERLAAVRLKQLVWPPEEGQRFRNVERVVPWTPRRDGE